MKAFALSMLIVCSFVHSWGQNIYFEKVNVDNVIIDSPIQNITKDSLGYIWVGTWNGLFRYDGHSFDVYKHDPDIYNNIPDSKIRNLITDNNQQLWFITYEDKYIKYNYTSNQFHIIKDELEKGSVAKYLLANSNELNSHKQIDGYRYFLSHHCLATVKEGTGDTIVYNTEYSKNINLPDDVINCYYIDNQDIIWIGTEKGNIYKVNLHRLQFNLNNVYNQKNNQLIQCQTSSILKLDDEIWLGTLNNGIQIKNNKGEYLWNHPYYKKGRELTDILSLYQDRYSNIWIGTKTKGLWCYDQRAKQLSKLLDNDTPGAYISQPYFYCIYPSVDEHIWAGAYRGIFRINTKTKSFIKSDLHKLVAKISIRDIIQAKNQKIWIATDGYCVFGLELDDHLHCTDTITIKDFAKVTGGKYEGECAYCLLEDRQGNIWSGTSEGLYRINQNDLTITPYTKDEGLLDDYICALEEDDDGNIWVSSKKGISKIQYVDQSISNYTISDESRNWVFIDGSSFKDTVQHEIYFGAREGYVRFNPRLIHTTAFSPKVILEEFYLNGKAVYPNEKVNDKILLDKVLGEVSNIEIAYNNNFSIKYSALNFQNSNSEKYYYKLEGYNDDWVESTSNMATYIKVPHGNYRFLVKSISSDNIISNTASFTITILPPWYATTLAYVCYVIFILLVVYIISKIKAYQQKLKNDILIEKINAEKQEEISKDKVEFFTNVSHELRTPLTLIADPLKQLLNKNVSEKKKQTYLSMIKDNVENLEHLVNQVLNFRRMEVIEVEPKLMVTNIIESIFNCIHTFDAVAYARQIKLHFKADPEILYGNFDAKIIEQIVINILSNSIKYTQSKGFVNISVSTNLELNVLHIEIEDNGNGMSQQQVEKIFTPFNKEESNTYWGNSSGLGMALTQKYIDLLNGTIKVESEVKKGTLVKVDIPFVKADEQDVKQEVMPDIETYEPVVANPNDRKTVLVVEDNPDIQRYLDFELNEQYHIIAEFNGADGFKKAQEIMPDVIISDVMMPVMDGIELCNKIKTNEKTSHIPVMLLTAKGTDEDRIEGLKTGADIYVSKPFSVEVLKAQVNSLIENRLKLQAKLSSKKFVSDLESNDNKEDTRFLKKTVVFIKEHFEEVEFGPEPLARLLNLSERQLYRKLKAISGSTVNEFIKRVKMEEASRMLINTDLKVYEVSYKLGFSEPSNFTRTFTSHFGCSPSEYVKRN